MGPIDYINFKYFPFIFLNFFPFSFLNPDEAETRSQVSTMTAYGVTARVADTFGSEYICCL